MCKAIPPHSLPVALAGADRLLTANVMVPWLEWVIGDKEAVAMNSSKGCNNEMGDRRAKIKFSKVNDVMGMAMRTLNAGSIQSGIL